MEDYDNKHAIQSSPRTRRPSRPRHELRRGDVAYPYEVVGDLRTMPLPEPSRKTKLIATAILLAIGLLSFFVIAEFAASPQTHAGTIRSLDAKKDTVMGLVGASSASSTAITLIPGDAGTPIAEKLVDLSSDFLVVVAAIYLEKYFLTIAGFVTFKILVPVSCLLVIGALFLREGYDQLRSAMAGLATKLFVFGIAMYLVVPASVFVSGMIEQTYAESIDQTIQLAEQTTQKIETVTEADAAQAQGEAQPQEEGQVDLLTTITQIPDALSNLPETLSSIPDTLTGWIDEAQEALNGFVEALAVMIVTSCVIPLLVLVAFLWLVKVILGINVDFPLYLLYPRSIKRHGSRHART